MKTRKNEIAQNEIVQNEIVQNEIAQNDNANANAQKADATELKRPELKKQLPFNDTWKNACENRYNVYKNYHETAWADVVAGKRRKEQYEIRLVETYTLYENACLMSYIDTQKLPKELQAAFDKHYNYNGKNKTVEIIEVNENDVLTSLMMKYANVKNLSDKLQTAASKKGLKIDWEHNIVTK